jgi:hypothetical protein
MNCIFRLQRNKSSWPTVFYDTTLNDRRRSVYSSLLQLVSGTLVKEVFWLLTASIQNKKSDVSKTTVSSTMITWTTQICRCICTYYESLASISRTREDNGWRQVVTRSTTDLEVTITISSHLSNTGPRCLNWTWRDFTISVTGLYPNVWPLLDNLQGYIQYLMEPW